MLTIFYDSSCSFCCRQMERLLKRDKWSDITFEDINDPGLILELYGLNYSYCAEEITAVVQTTSMNYRAYRGFDVYIVAHEIMGYEVVRYWKLPGIYAMLKLGYKIVSKVRKYI